MTYRMIKDWKLWKKKSGRYFFLAWAVLIFLCIIRIAIPCREYRYDGKGTFREAVPLEGTVYGGISLPPGVYRIELEYAMDSSLQGICSVADDTVFSGGLLSDGEALDSGHEKTDFHIWLLEGTDRLQVQVSCNGEGHLTTGSLRIVETNQLWTMLLTLLIFAGMLVYAAFLGQNREGPIPIERKQAFFLVMLTGFVASIPSLCGYTVLGTNLAWYLQRIEGLKDGLSACRLSVGLFLYFPAMLRLLGFPLTASYNIYCLALNLATAWISYFSFHHIFKNHWRGILCSALYTLSVYRMYALLVRSDACTVIGITFIPLTMYGIYRAFTENPRERKYRTAWIAIVIGLLLPLLDYFGARPGDMESMAGGAVRDGRIYFAQLAFHFWGGGEAALGEGERLRPMGIGLVLVLGLGLFLILWFSGRLRGGKRREQALAKGTALIGAALLFLGMRFPDRFLGWGTGCMVYVFGYCLDALVEEHRKGYLILLAAAFLGITTSDIYLLDHINAERDTVVSYGGEGLEAAGDSGSLP